ncbi:MAG: recombination protein O N-terminal domain-containing protein [Candidatus Buchananbacteria bacterium]|nr:recombination protein O N-terminal domain-containing protein [Candidatus Buchananbacteria bacterium]
MTEYLTAIIINSMDSGEVDRHYVVYSRERGKQRLNAIGTKKLQSKLQPFLQPGCEVRLHLATGKVHDRIIGTESVQLLPVALTLAQAASVQYLLEALETLVIPEAPDERIYDLARSFLMSANESDPKQLLVVLNQVILGMLRELGYEPQLTATSQITLLEALERQLAMVSERPRRSFRQLLASYHRERSRIAKTA